MANNNKKNNILIKKSGLISVVNNFGIKRINPEALVFIENYVRNELERVSKLLKQEIDTHGRKTVKKEDVLAVIEKMSNKEDSWEI